MLIALWALTKSLSPNLLECSTKHCEVWEERRTVFSSTYIPCYLPPQEGSSFWGSGKPKPERSGKEWRGRGAMCGHDALFRKKKKLASWRGEGESVFCFWECVPQFVAVINTTTRSTMGRKGLISASLPQSTVKENWGRNLEEAGAELACSGWLSQVYLFTFTTLCSGVAPPMVGCALPCQSLTKKTLYTYATD